MSEKTLNNIRVINKHDLEENWLKATGFTPKQGEIIVYDIDENYSYERMKIGDGVRNVNDLPFCIQQPDWNQTDEASPNYILNKPVEMTEDDMVDLLVEVGAINPVANNENVMYTNSSDKIYIL
jgi:hypothetical protein